MYRYFTGSLALAAWAFTAPAIAQTPLGSEWTYQGRLEDGSGPVDGTADFEFRLFDAGAGGVQVGAVESATNVSVVDGVFTVELDFGLSVLNGNARWLQVAARTPHDPTDTQPFTPLNPRQPLTGTPYSIATRGIHVTEEGNVGMGGVVNPTYPLTVNGTVRSTDMISYSLSAVAGSLVLSGAGWGVDVHLDEDDNSSDTFRILDAGIERFRVMGNNGFVGIGTSAPHALCEIAGSLWMTGGEFGPLSPSAGSGIRMVNDGTAGPQLFAYDYGSGTPIDLDLQAPGGNLTMCLQGGNVGIGIDTPTTKLDINGAITIRGGADIVEGFESTCGTSLEPGTVVVIDPANPGKLMCADGPYDQKVAGVVSGANGIAPGIKIGQEGVLDGDLPVAMTGRVYVKCSTENGAIRPGDLLTTAHLPGHAMKATDVYRRHGAVIGKAMSMLDEQTGLVLVLVNLQ